MSPREQSLIALLLVVSSLVSICDSDAHSSALSYANNSAQIAQIALELDKAMYGNAYARGTYEYEHRRPVHNGACTNIFPVIIAVPHSTEDVSLAVQTAVIHGLPVSFRSGGHSFICQVELVLVSGLAKLKGPGDKTIINCNS